MVFEQALVPIPVPAVTNVPVTTQVKITWNKATDPDVIGYRVYWNPFGTNFIGAKQVKFLTNFITSVTVTNNSTNYFWVTMTYLNGIDSPASEPMRYIAPRRVPSQTLQPVVWEYKTDGFQGMTNQVYADFTVNMANRKKVLTFIGNGLFTNIFVTNTTQMFFQVVAN